MTDVRTVSATHPAPGVLQPDLPSEQDGTPGDGHEQVVLCHDRASGLKAIIAIHSTALGPALGGTRFHPYASEEEALQDALRLSRGMTYKNALAGLDLGGGKAVIIGDPAARPRAAIKTEALLRAYGRFVQSLAGRYITACDVGTYVAGHGRGGPRVRLRDRPLPRARRRRRLLDADRLRRLPGHAGLGPAPLGRAHAARQAGRRRGRRQGRPLPGRPPGRRTVRQVVITDVSETAVDRVRAAHPEVEVVADSEALIRPRWTSTRRARWAARWTTTRSAR